LDFVARAKLMFPDILMRQGMMDTKKSLQTQLLEYRPGAA
jgi:hypothetical protein